MKLSIIVPHFNELNTYQILDICIGSINIYVKLSMENQ